jgi:putative NIF3 family GTP cyclohydrolase 1 type 2
MDLSHIRSILDTEFDIDNVDDDWSFCFDRLFIKKSVPEFRKAMKNTGLMIANSHDIQKIYTAFSPSRYVLEEIQMRGIANTLLVVKHPFDWDGRRNGPGFIKFTERDYQLMESIGISIYSLHTPMDKDRNDSVVSTAYAFAKAIKLKATEEFARESESYPNMNIGVIGKMNFTALDDILKYLASTLNYRPKVRRINDRVGKIAVVTGGGFIPRIMEEARDRGVNTYITGVITPNDSEYSRKNFRATLSEANKIGINVIGCSHYLTEKWAMQYSLPYFAGICKAEFIEDKEALNMLE